MKLNHIIIILCTFALAGACSPSGIKIGEPYKLGDVPSSISEVQDKQDPFIAGLKVEMTDLPGHDDLIFDPSKGLGYASGMDGWIWKLNFKTGKAEQWLKPPVNPAGMQYSDKKKDKILVCASRLGGEIYEEINRVGLYEVNIETKKIDPVILDLPKLEKEEFEKVYSFSEMPTVSLKDLNFSNSRPFSLCNDLAISEDGNRIYITEPFERTDAAMGSGAVPEAIGLYPHGKLWMLDRSKNTISLVLNGFTFVDGILLEKSADGKEESVVFTETTKFRIIRAFLSGKNQGSSEILFENLPGLADGLERDESGRIWTGIIKRRSGLVNFVHKNPWLKKVILSLPQKILPISHNTGILVIDPSGKKPLYYSMHDGTKIKDISVSVPFEDRVYFPSFDKTSRGLYSLPISSLKIKEF
ncbi:SMP-30/gluconolaconase/LRE-like region [Leptospira selangorensis]|uniref:SMP-30/gluconolaconase/LRE-like region n=1 Tax=Leptospira selangorensis TaxID=2484982 RepID=A0A5F2BVZ2_9LEPT|nr:SMP-30/gluconolactonase/LRE family protein [Leptospira selangorensis]TGM12067.1 SMP-30/gluconolaconase/LRE-like region [Leptospira selangorensis]TGM15072.1 SMP-30/gluconolaconase/LRE-like region [Leptospira selangorensis]